MAQQSITCRPFIFLDPNGNPTGAGRNAKKVTWDDADPVASATVTAIQAQQQAIRNGAVLMEQTPSSRA